MTDGSAESLTDLVTKLQALIAERRRAGDLVALLATAEAAADEIERRAGGVRNDAGREAMTAARRFTFNAAADCWPAWSVSDRPPDTQILVRALELAKRSVFLVNKLGLGHLQEGTGTWLSGAFELALGRHAEAYSAFALAREHYMAAKAPGLVMLTEGYIALVCQIARDGVPACRESLDEVCARIASGGFEDGTEWIEQLRTARKVFLGWSSELSKAPEPSAAEPDTSPSSNPR
jgi:hypothetical protein